MPVRRKTNTFDVYDAKSHPTQVLKKLRAGEEVTITRDGSPVATLVPVARTAERELAAAVHRIQKRATRRSRK